MAPHSNRIIEGEGAGDFALQAQAAAGVAVQAQAAGGVADQAQAAAGVADQAQAAAGVADRAQAAAGVADQAQAAAGVADRAQAAAGVAVQAQAAAGVADQAQAAAGVADRAQAAAGVADRAQAAAGVADQAQAAAEKVQAARVTLSTVVKRVRPLEDRFQAAKRVLGVAQAQKPTILADVAEAERHLRDAQLALRPELDSIKEAVEDLREAGNKVPGSLEPLPLVKPLEAAANKVQSARDYFHTVAGEVRTLAGIVESLAGRVRTLEGEVRDAECAAVTDAGGVGVGDRGLGETKKRLGVAVVDLRSGETKLRDAGERLKKAGDKVLEAGNKVPDNLEPFPPIAYTEITNLLLLKDYPEHEKALEEWLRREKDLSLRVSRREARSGDVTNHIFNIIGWYAVFVGVVLTAVSQLTQTAKDNPVSVCGKTWFPVLLTVFGTLITFVGIFNKFTTLKSLEVTIQSEKQISEELQRRVNTLQRIGPQRFSFSRDTKDCLPEYLPKSFWINKILVFVSLFVLAVFFCLSYFVILCNTLTVR